MKNFFSLGGISAAIAMQANPTFAASPTAPVASLVQAHRPVQSIAVSGCLPAEPRPISESSGQLRPSREVILH